jgi:hypothetical protein
MLFDVTAILLACARVIQAIAVCVCVSRATNFITVFSGPSMFLDPEGIGLKIGRCGNFHECRLVGALLVVANFLSGSETVCSIVEVMDMTEDNVLGLGVNNSSVSLLRRPTEAASVRFGRVSSSPLPAALSFPSCSFPYLSISALNSGVATRLETFWESALDFPRCLLPVFTEFPICSRLVSRVSGVRLCQSADNETLMGHRHMLGLV